MRRQPLHGAFANWTRWFPAVGVVVGIVIVASPVELGAAGGGGSADAEARDAVVGLLNEARAARVSGSKDDAAAAYQRAAERAKAAGSASLVAAVANDRAVALLAAGEAQRAVEAWADVPIPELSPDERGIYLYNYGRCLQEAGRAQDAAERFQQAARVSPGFAPAQEAVLRQLLGPDASATAGAAEAVRCIEALLAAGEARRAGRYLPRCLRKWEAAREIGALFDQLATVYVLTGMTPARYQVERPARDFEAAAAAAAPADIPADIPREVKPAERPPRRSERSALMALAEEAPGLRRGIGPLDAAFTHRAKATFTAEDPAPFESWPGRRDVLSRLLKVVADHYVADGQVEGALYRYSSAWQLDNGNRDAAVACAALLREPELKVDPEGQRRRQLVDLIFESKNNIYLQPIRDDRDVDALVRLHTILGTIFSAEESAPATHAPRSQYETALFQWSRAAEWQEKLRDNPKYQPIPEINANYADVLSRKGQQKLAVNQYLLATRRFLDRDDGEAARRTLTAVKRVAVPLPAGQKAEVAKLEDALNRLPEKGPGARVIAPDTLAEDRSGETRIQPDKGPRTIDAKQN